MFINIDDIKINYEEYNDGEPLILLHGWGQDLSTFTDFRLTFSDYKVYAIDFPGFGLSEEPSFANANLDYYVFILSEFIRKKGIKNPIIISHSFGCRVSLMYSRYNDVKKQVLISSPSIKFSRGISYYSKVYLYKLFKVLGIKLKTGSSDYNNCSGILRRVFYNTVNTELINYSIDNNTDTYLIYGINDSVTDFTYSKEFVKRMKKVNVKFLYGIGHFPYLEDIEATSDAVLDFLGDNVV